MQITLDYTNLMVEAVGPERGIRDEDLEQLQERATAIHADLATRRREGELPFYDLPFRTEEVEEIVAAAEGLAERFDNLVVLGIGGSALGTVALHRALGHLHHNLLGRDGRGGRPRLFVLDNVDPTGFAQSLEILDPEQTLFLVISKSGTTVETMSQFLYALSWMEKRVGKGFREHFVLVTDPDQGTLRRLGDSQGFRTFAIPPGVGGRFSVFTPVGLLPLAVAGVDIQALLAGARGMAATAQLPGLLENPAYLNAALQYLAYHKGMPLSVMMPYSDRLRDVADWYRQLWAESLGKARNLQGELVHVGPTPIKALGTTDQHSQVQLYMEGPFDKVVTFLVPEDYGCELELPSFPGIDALDYLEGKTMAELIRSEQQATAAALTRNGRPNCTLRLPAVTAETVGGLVYLLEVQTLFCGGLFNVDPLDQPGVEEGKQFTYGLMGRPGFEAKAAEWRRLAEAGSRRELRVDLRKGSVR